MTIELLTARELAKRLNISPRTVENLKARRLIPVVRVTGRCHRYDWPAVAKALEKLTVREAA